MSKKTALLSAFLLSLFGVFAMNLALSSWHPGVDNSNNYQLFLNPGDNLSKICRNPYSPSVCYFAEWNSRDAKDYNLTVYCEGDGCLFFANIPKNVLLMQETTYKYDFAVDVPLTAKAGNYNASICGKLQNSLRQEA